MPLLHPSPPLIALLGAPRTGAAALALALQQRIAPGAAQIVLASPGFDTSPPAGQSPSATPTRPLTLPSCAALTLLMGLDQPCPAEDRAAQEHIDAQLRAALKNAGVPYRVIYGHGERRTMNALNAIKNIATEEPPTSAEPAFDADSAPRARRLRAWDCEKCSDPDCEHRLFTTLVDNRHARPN